MLTDPERGTAAGGGGPSSAPSIAVVVCSYTTRRLEQLLAAVGEARRQCAPTDQVVLVVDHSPELLDAVVPRLPTGVVVVENRYQRGLSGARNTGVAATSADVVAFLDDDAVPRPGWVAALRRRTSDPAVTVVAGAVHPSWEGGRAPAWLPEEFGWVVGCDYRGLPGDGGEVRNPIGACMAVRRHALEAVGGFSTELGRVGSLPVGCEETLMGIRVRQLLPGARLVRDEAFAVDHLVPASRQSVRYLLSRCLHEGRSKALVARAAGTSAALSSERSYVLRALSTGVVRDLVAAGRGDRSGLGRAAASLAGLASTATGYLAGGAAARRGGRTAVRPLASALGPAAADEPVTVVVCTLGRDPRLVGTVGAVLGQTHPRVELVVVDNDPASGRVSALLAGSPWAGDLRLRVVPEPVKGLSAARNAGLAAVTTSLVAYTDDDAVPDTTWLSSLVEVLRADEFGAVALVTGRVLSAESATVEQEWFEEAGIFDKGEQRTTWAMPTTAVPAHLGVPGVRTAFFPYTAGEMGSGNNMLFRTRVLRELGAFDEALGAGSVAQGGEDLDIFRRTVLAGHVVVYTPDAVVRHFHRDSYPALRAQMYGYGVGMAAVLTKIVLSGGRPALHVLRCVPRGLWTLLAPGSTKNAKKPAEMPVALIGVELLGYLAGPRLYVRSRRVAAQRRAAAVPSAAGRGPRVVPAGRPDRR